MRTGALLAATALMAASCDAFLNAGAFAPNARMPTSLKGSTQASARRSAVCPVRMAANEGRSPAAKALSGILGGFVASSLLLSPALDVLHGPGVSDGGVASAQGATSRKSTRGAPSKDANKDPESILRLTLPINDKNPIREVQAQLEMSMDKALREVKGEKWGKISGLNRKATNIVANKAKDILKDVPADKQSEAAELLASIEKDLGDLGTVIEGQKNKPVEEKKRAVLNKIGDLEQLMVKEFPYKVPKEFDNLPQLKGRATIDFVLKKGGADNAKFDVDGTVYEKINLRMVVDGYSAPVVSGNFVDLINKGFYTGMQVQRSDGFVIQTGDPNPEDEDTPIHGYVENGKERTIPLEIMAEEDKVPTYGVTLEDDGRPLSQPRLPFSVYGAVAMARLEDFPDSGSSQWFFLLFDPELVTAGRNLMDGRYSTFGYVVEGNRLLSNVEVGDIIESAKVVSGLENLQAPKK